MKAAFSVFCVFMVGIALTGCSWFSSDEPSVTAADEQQQVQAVPVSAVRSIEVGRSRDGIVISAFGTAPGLGYGGARLIPRRDGKPNREGFLEFDFVAVPPDPAFELPTGTLEARSIRADLAIKGRNLKNVRGIRVFSAQNGVQFVFTFG